MSAKPLYIGAAALEAGKAVVLSAAFALWGFSPIEGGVFVVAQALSGSVFAVLALMEAARDEASALRRIALPWKAIGLVPSILALASFHGKGPLPAAEDTGISLLLLFSLIADLCSIIVLFLAKQNPDRREGANDSVAGGA